MSATSKSFGLALTPEQMAVLAAAGIPVAPPARSTVLRRQAKQARPFPVISRSGRKFRDPDGRPYGEIGAAEQRQADAGFWRVGPLIRKAKEPMTVAVGGTVQRIYEVHDWEQDEESRKWVATLGRTLSDDELDQEFPDYPYRIGAKCPTAGGGAYRPETY